MASCTAAEYGRVSLAIVQKGPADAATLGAAQ
jgi:hypothetical protein